MYYVHHTCIVLFYAMVGWFLFRALGTSFGPIKSWAILGQMSPTGH